MTAVLRWTSIALFVLLGAFLVAFGVLYATVHNLLWFHAAAVPHESLDAVRPLYFALMKLIGGSAVALGVLGVYVTLFPLRNGVRFAGAALFVCYALPVAMAVYVAETLAATTGAPTSANIMIVLLLVDAVALAASLASKRRI